jgi:hypothetical protein
MTDNLEWLADWRAWALIAAELALFTRRAVSAPAQGSLRLLAAF